MKPSDYYVENIRSSPRNPSIEMDFLESRGNSWAAWTTENNKKLIVDYYYNSKWRLRLVDNDDQARLRLKTEVDSIEEVAQELENTYYKNSIVWKHKSPTEVFR